MSSRFMASISWLRYQGVIDEVGTLRVNIGMPVSK